MNRTLILTFAAMVAHAPVAAALAQPAGSPQATAQTGPKSYDFRDGTDAEMSPWINDPNIHAFYQMSVEAFAQGPDKLDRPAYVQHSHDIFRALALGHKMNPEALEDHLKLIPDQMVQMISRDPKTLASYDNFIVALFGPQKSGPGSLAQH